MVEPIIRVGFLIAGVDIQRERDSRGHTILTFDYLAQSGMPLLLKLDQKTSHWTPICPTREQGSQHNRCEVWSRDWKSLFNNVTFAILQHIIPKKYICALYCWNLEAIAVNPGKILLLGSTIVEKRTEGGISLIYTDNRPSFFATTTSPCNTIN